MFTPIVKGECIDTHRECTGLNAVRYWGIFWIDASTENNILQGFSQIARTLEIGGDIETAKRVLTNKPEPWLLIFDNADDPELSLGPFFPSGDRGSIIITSRNPMCCQYSSVGSREIGPLLHEDALRLLAGTALDNASLTATDVEDGKTIVQALGHLALAISQAGAYIRETMCTLAYYLSIYQTRRRELLDYKSKHQMTDYSFTVYTTWQISLDKIEALQTPAAIYAQELIKLLCLYHFEQIPIAMLHRAWDLKLEDPIIASIQLDPDVPVGSSDRESEATSLYTTYEQSVRAALTLLASFSLIQRYARDSISLHPLIHEWYRHKILQIDRASCLQRAISLLTRPIMGAGDAEDYDFKRSLVSHVHAYIRSCDSMIDDENIENWIRLAIILGDSGEYRDAIQILEYAVRLRTVILGGEHLRTLDSKQTLAVYYSQDGRQSEALQLFEQVVQHRKIQLGEEHPDTLSSMNNLAVNYHFANRSSESLLMLEQIIQLQKVKLGEQHPDTLYSMHNLAIEYRAVGRALRVSSCRSRWYSGGKHG